MAELSADILNSENNTYTPDWFRLKASGDKYMEIKAKADKERAEFIKNYGPDVLKNLNGKELLLKMFKGPKNTTGDYLINVLERRTYIFGSGNLGNAHNAGLLYKDQQPKWPKSGWAKRKGSNAEPITEDEAVSLAESVRDALVKSIDYFKSTEIESVSEYRNAENELSKYFENLNPVFRYTYIWVIKYIQMLNPSVFPTFYNQTWADFIIEKLGLDEQDTFITKLGSIALYIKKCGIDSVVFANIFYNEIGDPEKKLEWWPSDYKTGISIEEWKKIISDKSIFTDASLDVMKKYLDIGGAASCTQLSEAYGNTADYYRNISSGLAVKVCEALNIEPVINNDGELKYWPVLFTGRKTKKGESGAFIWKLRDELKTALTEHFEGTETGKYTDMDFLEDVFMSEQSFEQLKYLLLRKKNIILQGAPGVGKTFAAKRLAYSVMGAEDDSRIEFVQFHQNYSYEDFVMGYKPAGDSFELKQGVFYKFCKKAEKDSSSDYFFIIDEINRGNMSKIFGELLMLIERDYRGTPAKLAYNGELFSVPENLYIIGMMNTADRSLAMIDYALRRRFSFFDIEPGFETQGFKKYQHLINNDMCDKVIEKVIELNKAVSADRTLGPGFCIGHSYFCGLDKCSNNDVISVVKYDILPMLKEYWFDDEKAYKHWEELFYGVIYG